MKQINITSGEELNKILKNKYKSLVFIPFNEAMIVGTYTNKLFSEDFIIERAKTHKVTIEEYKTKLSSFISLLNELDEYDKITLWFGDEDFCKKNTEVVLQTLKEYNYKGEIIINIVDELTGDIKENN